MSMNTQNRNNESHTTTNNPEQNRISEKVNWTLMDAVRVVIYAEKVSNIYWLYDIQNVAYK